MEKLFIPYKLAWQLQHKRWFDHFKEECIAFWNHYHELHLNNTYKEYARHLKAPTYEQVLEWFREKHNLIITVMPQETKGLKLLYQLNIYKLEIEGVFGCGIIKLEYDFNSYCEALHKAIEEAIKLIQNENNNRGN